jgi:hypothetical protein
MGSMSIVCAGKNMTLAAYVGESVTLHFDRRDMAEIRVFCDG